MGYMNKYKLMEEDTFYLEQSRVNFITCSGSTFLMWNYKMMSLYMSANSFNSQQLKRNVELLGAGHDCSCYCYGTGRVDPVLTEGAAIVFLLMCFFIRSLYASLVGSISRAVLQYQRKAAFNCYSNSIASAGGSTFTSMQKATKTKMEC